eukprot:6212651-Pleurochrysis_carterae.AAC.3
MGKQSAECARAYLPSSDHDSRATGAWPRESAYGIVHSSESTSRLQIQVQTALAGTCAVFFTPRAAPLIACAERRRSNPARTQRTGGGVESAGGPGTTRVPAHRSSPRAAACWP